MRLSKSLSCSRLGLGEEEGSFRGSGLSPWGSKVGLPCSSTNVSAMQAIPVGQNPRQSPSTQHRVHPDSACLHLATPQLGPACHHLSCTVSQGRQGPQEGRQPGEQRLAVPVGSQGKKHRVWHRVSSSFQESLSCSHSRFHFALQELPGLSSTTCKRKISPFAPGETLRRLIQDGLTIPVLLRNRVQGLDTLQQPPPGCEGCRVPADTTPCCTLQSQPPPHRTPGQD